MKKGQAKQTPHEVDWKQVEKFLASRWWFTDCGLTDDDIDKKFQNVLSGENWDKFNDLFTSHGFELFEAKKKGSDFTSTIYVNFWRAPNAKVEPEISFSQKITEQFPPTWLVKHVKEPVLELARATISAKVKVGALQGGAMRIDLVGDLRPNEKAVLEKLENELGLEIPREEDST